MAGGGARFDLARRVAEAVGHLVGVVAAPGQAELDLQPVAHADRLRELGLHGHDRQEHFAIGQDPGHTQPDLVQERLVRFVRQLQQPGTEDHAGGVGVVHPHGGRVDEVRRLLGGHAASVPRERPARRRRSGCPSCRLAGARRRRRPGLQVPARLRRTVAGAAEVLVGSRRTGCRHGAPLRRRSRLRTGTPAATRR